MDQSELCQYYFQYFTKRSCPEIYSIYRQFLVSPRTEIGGKCGYMIGRNFYTSCNNNSNNNAMVMCGFAIQTA